MAGGGKRGLALLHVFAGPFPTVQGTQALVGTTCRLLAGRGHDVHLLCYAHAAFERREPFAVHRLPNLPRFAHERSGPRARKLVLDLLLASRLRRLAARLRPDVIHAHHYEALCAAALADPLRATPRVLHLHGLMEPELHTYLRPSLEAPARALGGRMDAALPFLADRVVALDGAGREALLRHGFPEGRIAVCRVPACPPPGAEAPARRERPPGEPLRAVYAGNLDGYQGLPVLLEAFRELSRAGGAGVALDIVTASDPARLEAGIARSGLRGAVRIVPHGTAEEVFRSVASADMAIVPRSARGGVPVKLVNALAAGVPVIADREIARELGHGVGAWLADMRSPGGLAAAIGAVAASEELRRRLSAGAREAAGRLHDPERYAAALEELYGSLSRRGGAAPACRSV